MSITSYEGKMGTGKTLSATAMAYIECQRRLLLIEALEMTKVPEGRDWKICAEELSKKFGILPRTAEVVLREANDIFAAEGPLATRLPIQVTANYRLNWAPTTLFDLDFFLEVMDRAEGLQNCIFIMDEAYIYMDSRSTAAKLTKLFSYFIGQTRKRGVELFVCMHHKDVVEKRLRRAVNIRGICSFGPKGPVEELDKKGNILPIEQRRFNWATVNFTNVDNGRERVVKFYGPLFWSLYDTNEILPLERNQLTGIKV